MISLSEKQILDKQTPLNTKERILSTFKELNLFNEPGRSELLNEIHFRIKIPLLQAYFLKLKHQANKHYINKNKPIEQNRNQVVQTQKRKKRKKKKTIYFQKKGRLVNNLT